MESSTRNRNALVKAVTPLLAAEPLVVCAYLFGSVARGDAGPRSDVDIAVLTSNDVKPGLLSPLTRLKLDLEDALGQRVDLIHLNHAPPDLVHRVLRDGLLLIDKEPNRRISFEVQARNEYWDLLPILKEYRRAQGNP
ncbi:putative nucleotidyltransferase [Alkalispirillum mobile]|uniref:Putative nucleotidyltransferase n=1 Tax=Alkalispirillum mobile TaxID=85925 RepID=A0A498C5J2_9GAMM|nr:nucleotidyltransferase domain-containing protein [Alkalispirillum mobile]RLK51504.1 putative nucleotidyltransferase [Alkalispirillum mobile]